ncbi:MAG: tetratricopeptide repeat protein [Thermodesulfovibrionales bacterium]
MPKVIKKRTVKKQKPEEEIKTIITSTKGLIAKKQKIILPVVAIISAVILIIGGGFIYKASQIKKAHALEYDAYKTYYNLYQKQPIEQMARYQQALDKFKKAYSVKKTPLSLFYIASCYYGLGRFDDAMKALQELNQRFPDDENFVPLSYYKMAMISLKKGDNDVAIKTLQTLYNYKIGSFKDLALIESARILEGMDKKDEALKKYEELTKNFPNSPFIEEAKAKLGNKKG